MRVGRVFAAVLIATALVLALAACGSGTSGSCDPVDVKGVDGKPLDLTGEWTGNDQGRYSLKQVGGCLWWVGLSAFDGEEPGQTWANVFRGRLSSDMKVTGEFTDVKSPDKATGTLTLKIETEDAQGRRAIVLRRESLEGAKFGGNYWERAAKE